MFCYFFFFKQKTAYEMRISDWSSDVCSSDLDALNHYLHERVSIETAPGASAYWVSVPAGMDARELARQAAAIGVLVEPGCHRDGGEAPCMGVTGISAARIRDGVRPLPRLVRGTLAPSSRRIEDEAVAPLRGKGTRAERHSDGWGKTVSIGVDDGERRKT